MTHFNLFSSSRLFVASFRCEHILVLCFPKKMILSGPIQQEKSSLSDRQSVHRRPSRSPLQPRTAEQLRYLFAPAQGDPRHVLFLVAGATEMRGGEMRTQTVQSTFRHVDLDRTCAYGGKYDTITQVEFLIGNANSFNGTIILDLKTYESQSATHSLLDGHRMNLDNSTVIPFSVSENILTLQRDTQDSCPFHKAA